MFDHILLGIIQGITEFLPISSSGHLVLMQALLGFDNPEQNLLLDVILHGGTLAAVLIYFRSDILSLLSRDTIYNNYKRKVLFLILFATIPTGIIGITFEDLFEKMFASPKLVCITLSITGLLLLLSEKISKSNASTNISNEQSEEFVSITYLKAFVIGLVQGIAITPGISRSGSTIATGKLLGLSNKESFKFSFLISIPAVIGALLLQILKLYKNSELLNSTSIYNLFASFITSLISGILSLALLNFISQKSKLNYFSYYLFIVSFISFLIINYK